MQSEGSEAARNEVQQQQQQQKRGLSRRSFIALTTAALAAAALGLWKLAEQSGLKVRVGTREGGSATIDFELSLPDGTAATATLEYEPSGTLCLTIEKQKYVLQEHIPQGVKVNDCRTIDQHMEVDAHYTAVNACDFNTGLFTISTPAVTAEATVRMAYAEIERLLKECIDRIKQGYTEFALTIPYELRTSAGWEPGHHLVTFQKQQAQYV